jgi:hypothetical protein
MPDDDGIGGDPQQQQRVSMVVLVKVEAGWCLWCKRLLLMVIKGGKSGGWLAAVVLGESEMVGVGSESGGESGGWVSVVKVVITGT